jgi:UDP-N-acetylglucosamine diphosphorylase / glucose-1-phosphate thymidylyltransferase / UDP-N-acetylgalactosamine diphosphorylase / glucosamine-1-phosphate N-acetyltransferase / galactosamine-1-phosphate N-acetyltransferase
MFQQWKVSVVIPAYNEEGTIESVVRDFRAHPNVDEVLVVDNNCRDRTAELARAAGARVVAESAPGYGCALRRGLDEAQGDVIALVEADGSFRAFDLAKFLCYLPDCSMVLGTRTTRQMVQQGANMRSLLRWGNVTAAKILELLWFVSSEPRITDVGCTYRALHRSTWAVIRDGLSEAGAPFSPEMICEAFRCGLRVIEIPIHYFSRGGGESKHSKGFLQVARTGLRMLRTILRKRLAPRVGPERRAQAAALTARSATQQG